MTRTIIRTALAFAFVVVATGAGAQEVKIVANPGVAVTDISSADLTKIFLKQSRKFKDGSNAVAVDQAKASPARADFSQKLLGMTVRALDAYWLTQIFSGKDTPPAAKSSDDEVIAFVKATPGGIGYVSANAVTAGVKVIVIK